MRREPPELTDDDLERLAQLGGGVDQIAEAAGIDVRQVRRRLVGAERWRASSPPAYGLAGDGEGAQLLEAQPTRSRP